ncbi:MAG TPA: hypothetical protein VFM44_05625 [Gemmatimonadota bacterium]|nr:hypothetical protein [Gemmatimonadota bacterium]
MVDLEVAFSDSMAGIDPTTIRLVSRDPVKGPAGDSASLLEAWTVARLDSTGFIVEETVDNLLRRGRARLTVSAADRAGNETFEEISFELPPAARHKILDLAAEMAINTGQVTVGPDGTKAFVTTEENGGSAISIVDLETLTLLKVVRSPISALSETVVDAGRNRLYLVSIDEPLVAQFDLGSESFLTPIEISSRGIGAAISETRDELYIGLELVGPESGSFISVVDLGNGVEDRVIDLGVVSELNPDNPVNMVELLFGPGEDLLYATTSSFAQEGILVIEPDRGRLIDQIDLWPENPQRLGGALDIQLNEEDLLATFSNRVAAISLSSPYMIRFGFTAADLPLTAKELAVAPGGNEWALTTGDHGAGYIAVQLMESSFLRVVWEDRLPPTAVNPQGIAYRPDGNAFMVVGSRVEFLPATGPSELTIYLNR